MAKILDILIYVMSMVAGCFFGVMLLTILENVSAGFRNVVEKITSLISYENRKRLVFLVLILSAILGYMFLGSNVTRGGIIAGIIGGIPIYLKAGVTMGESFEKYDARTKKAAKDDLENKIKEKQDKKARKKNKENKVETIVEDEDKRLVKRLKG